MLTPQERQAIAKELRENYQKLSPDVDAMLADLQISEDRLRRVLAMNNPMQDDVRKVFDYLSERLNNHEMEAYPWSKLRGYLATKKQTHDVRISL